MHSAKKILGLIGRNVDYSYSPYIHNTAAEILQLPYYYTIFNIPSPDLVPPALEGAKALGIAGFNVTIPYKQNVAACMDKLSPEAEAVGAVNTIVNHAGTLVGYNTDIAGIITPLEPYRSMIEGQPIGIFGNGGAAMAAVEALNSHFRSSVVHLFTRNREKGRALCNHFRQKTPPVSFSIHPFNDYSALSRCKLLINATPIGTKGVDPGNSNSIIPPGTEAIHRGQIIFDMVYNPMETRLLKTAREAGAVTIPGIDMLIGQASRSFEIWTGKPMPSGPVKERLLKMLDADSRPS
ncbi:MAG: shikimate dehydrogenase [Chlorobiales bacterium]|nr:shikimate dehydrogenase [Chlorobiales bacterium]